MQILKHIKQHIGKIAVFLLLITSNYTLAQEPSETFLKGIDIPLIVISTDDGIDPQGYSVSPPENCIGTALAGNDYKTGRMIMTHLDSVIYDSGEYAAGASGIRIRLRGNTSTLWDKKPYKLKLSKKFDLFRRNDKKYRSKDWVLLNCPLLDLNTFLGFKVNELLGVEWTPKAEFVNIVLNGDYKGLYILCESIEQGEGRFNVSTNGFIVEDDAYWWNEDVYFKGNLLPYSMGYTFKYPDTEDISPQYLSRINDYFLEIERRLKLSEDISEYIDLNSFASWLLGHDILGTEDAAGSNRYISKHDFIQDNVTNSKLKMGPLWDFDNIFTRDTLWSQQHGGNYRYYHEYLLDYPEFMDEFVKVWVSVKEFLYNDIMEYFIELEESKGEALDLCRELDSQRWKRHGYNLVADDVRKIDEWMSARLEWIDEQLRKETHVEVVEEEYKVPCIYTLDGRLVSFGTESTPVKLPRGIYIRNGKKITVK